MTVHRKDSDIRALELEKGLSMTEHKITGHSISVFGQANSNLVGQIYCTFPMGKPMILCNDVPSFNDWPANFQFLF